MSTFHPELGATPPAPPPKPGSHETSRMATPSTSSSIPPPPPPPPTQQQQQQQQQYPGYNSYNTHEPSQLQYVTDAASPPPGSEQQQQQQQIEAPQQIPDPGEAWLPEMLKDKSIQDLAAILASPQLLRSLTHAPGAAHPSVTSSHASLAAALAANAQLAAQLCENEARLSRLRAATQARLLATHGLERQWRQRQSDVDRALAPFSPAALYQELAAGVQEQAYVCAAMEDSFLDGAAAAQEGGGGGGGGNGGGGGLLTEREVAEWVRGYREAKVLYYLRQERKERWDEGRVGGWR